MNFKLFSKNLWKHIYILSLGKYLSTEAREKVKNDKKIKMHIAAEVYPVTWQNGF